MFNFFSYPVSKNPKSSAQTKRLTESDVMFASAATRLTSDECSCV